MHRTLIILLGTLVCLALGADVARGRSDERKVAGFVKKKNFAWRSYDTEHFRIYAETGSYADAHIEQLKERLETIHLNVLKFIGQTEYPRRSYVFLVGSRARMKELTGDEVNGLAMPAKGAVFSVVNASMSGIANHEFFHLYAPHFWGPVKSTFVSEGLAVNSDDEWHSQDLHALAKFLKARGRMVSIAKLVDGFRDADDLVSYPVAGSFMKFLSERYGRPKVRSVWTEGERGFSKVFGKSIGELESEWLAVVDRSDAGGVRYLGW